jgi:hypothetical protein
MSVVYPVSQVGGKDATDNERKAEDRSDHGSDGWKGRGKGGWGGIGEVRSDDIPDGEEKNKTTNLKSNTNALNAITLSLRATNGSVAISPYKQGIASAPPRNDILLIAFVLVHIMEAG